MSTIVFGLMILCLLAALALDTRQKRREFILEASTQQSFHNP